MNATASVGAPLDKARRDLSDATDAMTAYWGRSTFDTEAQMTDVRAAVEALTRAIVEIPPKRARARVQPRAENTSISAYASPDAMDPADVELAQLVARVVGRRAPATRALTERMLRDATPMEVN